jgi:hypothetical protein
MIGSTRTASGKKSQKNVSRTRTSNTRWHEGVMLWARQAPHCMNKAMLFRRHGACRHNFLYSGSSSLFFCRVEFAVGAHGSSSEGWPAALCLRLFAMLALWPRGAVVCSTFLFRSVVLGDGNQSDSWPGRLARVFGMCPKCIVDFNTSAHAMTLM